MMTDRTLRLADGRTLAFEASGDDGGAPVILAHGFPGSRLEARVVVGGRLQGCEFELTRNDGSGVAGTFACSGLEGMSAEGAERPTVDIKVTFSADR